MRLQSTSASCGPSALRTALMVRGITRGEQELEKLCGYKPAVGTTARGMVRALLAIAKDYPQIMPCPASEARADIALLRLMAAHRAGLVSILLVDNHEHWVVSFGTLGDNTIHVADSDDSEMVLHYSPEQLLARWRGPGKKPFYGIIV